MWRVAAAGDVVVELKGSTIRSKAPRLASQDTAGTLSPATTPEGGILRGDGAGSRSRRWLTLAAPALALLRHDSGSGRRSAIAPCALAASPIARAVFSPSVADAGLLSTASTTRWTRKPAARITLGVTLAYRLEVPLPWLHPAHSCVARAPGPDCGRARGAQAARAWFEGSRPWREARREMRHAAS